MTSFKTPTFPLADIIVEGRLREDMGDVTALAESIRDNGLLHPLVVERVSDEPLQMALRAGGRRYAALTLLKFNKVENPNPAFYNEVPVTVFNEMPEHQRVVVELEENLARKDMNWKELVEGIVKYHKAAKRAALLDGDTWGQSKTGDMLNMKQAKISVAFKLYEQIKAGNKQVLEAQSVHEAMQVLFKQELDRAEAEQMRRIKLKREEQAAAASASVGQLPKLPSGILVAATAGLPSAGAPVVTSTITREDIAGFYHLGDALKVLPVLAKNTTINHIVCDPPYGIDMENLTSDNIERVQDTHQVEDNLKLLPEFLRISFDCVQEDGFLCMWYDLDHHEKIAQWARSIGWRVQRWPLVWAKTSSCSNSQAQYNLTKVTEVCYYMRRSEKSILRRKGMPNYHVSPNPRNATHPFTKPDDLWGRILDDVSGEGQTIVDPFAGEGSSLAAAFKRKRVPVGIECDEKHIASGLNYIHEHLTAKSILDDIILPPF